jgi:SAM-dependent methyltransferase
MTLPIYYFDRLYARSKDPWEFRGRWYEERKRALTLAALPRRHYASIFEPGCSIGELSAALAVRCDALFASDGCEAAVTSARARLTNYPHARVEKRRLPAQWPERQFELVVISELGYYFDTDDLSRLVTRVVDSLAPGGALLACHWRHVVPDYPLTGDQVHAKFNTIGALHRLLRHEEADFLLELWSRDTRSVAQTEELI